ncbi:MAG: NAD-dependent epimerase [Cyclobacteriaceae bacterium]|nr:NAD-dependent epimerase [Cyclobacteriaceae bacterium]
MKILITGGAGFIGYHLSKRLLEEGHEVTGLDNINDYYDVNLKYHRLEDIGINRHGIETGRIVSSSKYDKLRFIKLSLEDSEVLDLFKAEKFDVVVNLAAQAGVRYSLINPKAYIDSNIVGFLNILEGCRHSGVGHLVYASSSSVYGLNEKMPFSIHDNVDHPISLYAASKKSNELMAHTYSHLFNIPTTGLRFFTVYGPWGRPDMALFLFTKAILAGEPIHIFNNGKMRRDFTYVDDIVSGVMNVIKKKATVNKNWKGEDPDPGTSCAPYRIYNIGNSNPESLMDFIAELEKQLGKEAIKNFEPMQPGDVEATWANVDDLVNDFNYKPGTSVEKGVKAFVDWYRFYHKV